MAGFPPDLYAGTAEYYDRFRPRYPLGMIGDLVARIGSGGVLVDLACGTGQVALPMAPHYDSVLAVDLEPDMVAVGSAAGRRAGIANVRWQVGRAEELEIAPGSVQAVTIANAFHRLDRPLVAARAKSWLRPGGSLVVLGYGDPPDRPRRKEPWQEVVAEVVRRWIGPPSPAVVRALSGPPHRVVLDEAGYKTERREWSMPRRWTLDELVGLTFSVSTTSKRQLGDRADAFEADLRSALLACDEAGEYHEELRYFAIVGTTRPRED
jgi:SAM-dependent methyltransferase